MYAQRRLKAGELVAMMGDCSGAMASEDADSADRGIALRQPTRTPKSLRASRRHGVDKWMDRGDVERWSRAETLKAGVPIFRSRWCDAPDKEKAMTLSASMRPTRARS